MLHGALRMVVEVGMARAAGLQKGFDADEAVAAETDEAADFAQGWRDGALGLRALDKGLGRLPYMVG